MKNPNWNAEVKEVTGGRDADCYHDVIGGDMFMQCVRASARGGRICVAGFVVGSFSQLPMNLVLVKGLTCSACTRAWPPNRQQTPVAILRVGEGYRDEALHLALAPSKRDLGGIAGDAES